MAYNNSSSSVAAELHSNRSSSPTSVSPPSSPGPSSQQAQNRILNRMSTLFGGGKKKSNSTTIIENAGVPSSSSAQATTNNDLDNETLVASQVDSMFNEERHASCVDSMYSSLQSRRSAYRPAPNPNTPAPLRTVQLDNPIVHLPSSTPPTPPPNNLSEQSTKPTSSSSAVPHSPSPPLSSMANEATIKPPSKSTPLNASSRKVEDIEAQFKLLLREYAPSADHINNVNNLTFEQKEMLLRSSRSPALMKKNSTFSHVIPSFSLKATFGIKSKGSNKSARTSIAQDQLFNTPNDFNYAETTTVNGGIFTTAAGSDNKLMHSVKANTAPGRYGRSRSALPNNGQDSYGRSTSRSKLKSTPEYFVHLLQETHVRDLEDAEVLDLRVFLRSVVVSWTSGFLAQGGYEAIANLFKQMKEAEKREPNDNRMLQHLGKCLKTIMTHQSMGTQIVLTNPSALYHIRDILFAPGSKKQKQIYGLEISTRSLLLNLLCTLATLQTSRASEVEYVHGYDVLRRLLLDRPSDRLSDDEEKKSQPKHVSPFPISLKTDPKEILQMIMEKDPNGQTIGQEYKWDLDELKPRYTSWMRELEQTVEHHIETITFLAQVLNYDFKSAYRQLKMRQNQTEQEAAANPESSGSVMTEEGVVDYIVTHLRLIRTVVTTQPTTYTGNYDEREQEKMRLELMLSGFDKISKILIQCPHPTVRSSYINYLKPLMNPCADLSVPTVSQQLQESLPPPLPSRRNLQSYSDPSLGETFNDSLSDDYEMSVYVEDDMDDVDNSDHIMLDRQWKYEDQPYYDDIFHDEEYIEDHFNSDEEDSSDASANNVNCFYYDEENDTTVYNHDKAHFASASATTRIVDLEQQRQS